MRDERWEKDELIAFVSVLFGLGAQKRGKKWD